MELEIYSLIYKAYDCLSRELLIAKLTAYGVSHHSLSLLHNYPLKSLAKSEN